MLKRIPLEPGDVVADIGCGEGLLGLAALERPGVRVAFLDHSPTLVEHARAAVRAIGAEDRARFAVADATSLAPLADASVDAVVTRSVLAYVDDKPAAFREAHRVLRPGGRLSIAEPVFRDAAFRLAAMRGALASGDPDLELLHRWHALALPDTLDGMRAHVLTNYDERTLVQHAIVAGFTGVHARLHLDQHPAVPTAWETMLETALLPGTPTLGAALAEHYTDDERARFVRRFRPMFEAGLLAGEVRAMAFVWASRA